LVPSEGIGSALARAAHALDDALISGKQLDAELSTSTASAIQPLRHVMPSQVLKKWDFAFTSTNLAITRGAVGQALASVAAIEHAGGADAVVAAGGLDAVEGAAEVYHATLLNDLGSQIDNARPHFRTATSIWKRVSDEARWNWIEASERILNAQNHLLGTTHDPLTRDPLVSGELLERIDALRQASRFRSDELRTQHPGFMAALDALRSELTTSTEGSVPTSKLVNNDLRVRRLQSDARDEIENIRSELPALGAEAARTQRLQRVVELVRSAQRIGASMEAAFAEIRSDRTLYESVVTPYREPLSALSAELAQLLPAVDAADEHIGAQTSELFAGLRPLTTDDSRGHAAALETLRTTSPELIQHVEALIANQTAFAASDETAERVNELVQLDRLPADELTTLITESSHPRTAARSVISAMLHHRTTDPAAIDPRNPDEVRAALEEGRLLFTAARALRPANFENHTYYPQETTSAIGRAAELLEIAESNQLPIQEQTARRLSEMSRHILAAVRDPERWGVPRYHVDQALGDSTAMIKDIDQLSATGAGSDLKSVSPTQRPLVMNKHVLDWQLQRLDVAQNPTAVDALDEKMRVSAARMEILAGLSDTVDRLIELDPTSAIDSQRRIAQELSEISGLWQLPEDTANRLIDLKIGALESMAKGTASRPATHSWQNSLGDSLRSSANELVGWSYMDGGRLAATDEDRKVIASQRVRAIAPIADQLANAAVVSPDDPKQLIPHYRNAYNLIQVVLDAGEPFLERSVIDRLRSTSAAIEHDLCSYAIAEHQNTTSAWMPTYSLYTQIAADAREIDRALNSQLGIELTAGPSAPQSVQDMVARAESKDPAPRWEYLNQVVGAASGTKDDFRYVIPALEAVRNDVPAENRPLYTTALTLAHKTLARINSQIPEGATTFRDHPDPSELARMKATVSALSEIGLGRSDRTPSNLEAEIEAAGTTARWDDISARLEKIEDPTDRSLLKQGLEAARTEIPSDLRPAYAEAMSALSGFQSASDLLRKLDTRTDLTTLVNLMTRTAVHGDPVVSDVERTTLMAQRRKTARWDYLSTLVNELHPTSGQINQRLQVLEAVRHDIPVEAIGLYTTAIDIAHIERSHQFDVVPTDAVDQFRRHGSPEGSVRLGAYVGVLRKAAFGENSGTVQALLEAGIAQQRSEVAWRMLQSAAEKLSLTQHDLVPVMQMLKMVEPDIRPEFRELHREAVTLADRNWSRVNGVVPDGAVNGYLQNPEFAELGQLRSKISFMIDVARPTRTESDVISW
jgi:hypothetical protein